MRIDRTNPFDALGLPEGTAAAKSPRTQSAEGAGQAGEARLQAQIEGLDSYVLKAAQTSDMNLQAVEEAKRLLQSGQLDTPEAARRAAQSILSLGE